MLNYNKCSNLSFNLGKDKANVIPKVAPQLAPSNPPSMYVYFIKISCKNGSTDTWKKYKPIEKYNTFNNISTITFGVGLPLLNFGNIFLPNICIICVAKHHKTANKYTLKYSFKLFIIYKLTILFIQII